MFEQIDPTAIGSRSSNQRFPTALFCAAISTKGENLCVLAPDRYLVVTASIRVQMAPKRKQAQATTASAAKRQRDQRNRRGLEGKVDRSCVDHVYGRIAVSKLKTTRVGGVL